MIKTDFRTRIKCLFLGGGKLFLHLPVEIFLKQDLLPVFLAKGLHIPGNEDLEKGQAIIPRWTVPDSPLV